MLKFENTNNTEQQEKIRDIQTWTDLFRYTIEIAKAETHCGTLAFYKEIVSEWNETDKYGIATFTPFPIQTDQEEFYLNAYFFKAETVFEENKIYCILFMDNNFIGSLHEQRVLKTQDTEKHSLTYGIVIDTL